MFDDFDVQIQCEEVYEYGKYFLEVECIPVVEDLAEEEKAEYYIKY